MTLVKIRRMEVTFVGELIELSDRHSSKVDHSENHSDELAVSKTLQCLIEDLQSQSEIALSQQSGGISQSET